MSRAQDPSRFAQFPGFSFKQFLVRAILALVLITAVALLSSCGSGNSSSQGSGHVSPSGLITLSATMTPAFDPAVTDYAFVAPTSGSVTVSVNAPTGTQVSVDGNAAQPFSFTKAVKIASGQSFPVVVTTGATSNTYNVRCLPTDFPTWTTVRGGTTQAQFYAITPNISTTAGAPTGHYLIIVDGNGVPVWWYHSTGVPNNPLVLANGNIACAISTQAAELTLNGTIARNINIDPTIGGTFDGHEIQQLSNGDYIIIADVNRGPVDLTAENGLANAMVVDNIIEEIAPNGTLVWSWSVMDHVPASETVATWWPQYIQNLALADPYHMNSVEPNGDGFIVSCRQLDAIFRINKASGNIEWKLGGTPTSQSLKFVADTYGYFGGQHDARMLSDGTLTVHDNGSLANRVPRAVRYAINTTSNTATLLEHLTDTSVSSSQCCGSARKLAGGNWGIDWGENPVITELTPAGKEVLKMTFNQPVFSYRAPPIPAGTYTVAALRNAMDTQFPR